MNKKNKKDRRDSKIGRESFTLYLSSYDHKVLDGSVQKIVEVIKDLGAKISGPIPMPTKIERYTVIKAPHNYNSKEQFEKRTHKRFVVVEESNPKVISSLASFSLPAGVRIEMKQF